MPSGGELGEPLPGEPVPPRFEAPEIDAEAGRRIRAESVRGHPDEKLSNASRRESDTRHPSDLDPGERETVKRGREIGEDAGASLPPPELDPGVRLSASEMEERFKRFSKSMEKLDVEERRVVEEYYRRLRDIR